MQSYLKEVVEELWSKYGDFTNLIFVLPNKRAGTFLKSNLAQTASSSFFSPPIYGIEGFVEHLSQITYASNTELLFELYNAYLKTEKKKKDSFLEFSQWSQTLLQDFNEIDRYLIDTDKIFSYLSAIKEMGHWYLKPEKTELIKDYIRFWNNLPQLYKEFNSSLTKKEIGYQGMVYRKAYENLSDYILTSSNSNKVHVFIGFNALNTAESQIIQQLLENTESHIYWDLDNYFYKDPVHDAGYFIRQHKKEWPYFKTHPLKGLGENFVSEKHIEIIGVPKNVSQAKYVGNLLSKNKNLLTNAALVLGDETLLNPILNSIPKEIEEINITMGYPLSKSLMSGFFAEFFDLHIHHTKKGWYYKEVFSFLLNPYVQQLFSKSINTIREVKEKNKSYINTEELTTMLKNDAEHASLLFFENTSTSNFITKCLGLITALKSSFSENRNVLELEHLYKFYNLFNQLQQAVNANGYIEDLKSLKSLYLTLITSETLDFKGEPLHGLQIMGMLESRNLDFETVILTSVNEGILPAGKSNNSFIPFDVKKDFGLPTYKEKDAVYTYHFYRLLQRAKNIYILYNTEPDVLEGGEKSRLIAQLLNDTVSAANIKNIIASSQVLPSTTEAQTIKKDVSLIATIAEIAKVGFSPTSLSNYIRNPIDFYKKSILKINDITEVEETIAANTFGTVVHDSLEDLYEPFIGSFLSPEGLEKAKSKINSIVQHHFAKSYKGDITTGKNLIAFNVVLKYIETFIEIELREIEFHEIKILGLETKLNTTLTIPELNSPVVLKGKLDRIDEKDGVLRIIDYKTGKVEAKHLKVTDWEELTASYDKSKAFQLLCYALMFNSDKPVEAGMYSFKNLKAGFLPYKDKSNLIDKETLVTFQEHLKNLILEIFNPEVPFTEKEV